MRRIRALLRERGGLFGYETRLWRRDGSHIEVLMNLLLRHDEEELVEGFVADITERVQAQQRLQTMNEELERRVAERTHELEELNRQFAPGARRRRSRQPQQGQVPRRRQPRPAATAQRGAAAGRHPA
ncbi:PAS domain S-box protein [Pseudomonas aeruginosa]|uniref:PAS domain S-box protein n=1 Tax=Pseudomonas aeruginosa TaxID=287 RepID=UPI0039A602DB